jgi:hypothetical protein
MKTDVKKNQNPCFGADEKKSESRVFPGAVPFYPLVSFVLFVGNAFFAH